MSSPMGYLCFQSSNLLRSVPLGQGWRRREQESRQTRYSLCPYHSRPLGPGDLKEEKPLGRPTHCEAPMTASPPQQKEGRKKRGGQKGKGAMLPGLRVFVDLGFEFSSTDARNLETESRRTSLLHITSATCFKVTPPGSPRAAHP